MEFCHFWSQLSADLLRIIKAGNVPAQQLLGVVNGVALLETGAHRRDELIHCALEQRPLWKIAFGFRV